MEGRTIRASFSEDVHDIGFTFSSVIGRRTRRNWSWIHVQRRGVLPFVFFFTAQTNTRGRPTKMTLRHPHVACVIIECRKEAFQSLCLRCKATEQAPYESTLTSHCTAEIIIILNTKTHLRLSNLSTMTERAARILWNAKPVCEMTPNCTWSDMSNPSASIYILLME